MLIQKKVLSSCSLPRGLLLHHLKWLGQQTTGRKNPLPISTKMLLNVWTDLLYCSDLLKLHQEILHTLLLIWSWNCWGKRNSHQNPGLCSVYTWKNWYISIYFCWYLMDFCLHVIKITYLNLSTTSCLFRRLNEQINFDLVAIFMNHPIKKKISWQFHVKNVVFLFDSWYWSFKMICILKCSCS